MQNNETPDFCKGCGNCCTTSAGIYSPSQVLPQLIALSEGYLDLGYKYQIDRWDGEKPIYWLRPVHTNSKYREVDYSWGGTCINLTSSGCKLSFYQRPYQCQTLEATAPKTCEQKALKSEMRDLWLPFQHYFQSYFNL